MNLQTIINRVLVADNAEETLRGEGITEIATLNIDPREVRRILKGREQARTEGEFRGFGSPPGRF